MLTYLGCTIGQVTVKSFGRSNIILFSKTEIDKNRDVGGREENICWPEEKSAKYYIGLQARCART